MKLSLALLLVPTLLLAGCGSEKLPANSETPPEVNALSGTLADGGLDIDADGRFFLKASAWTGGAGSVNLTTGTGNGGPELSSTPLGVDGKFSFASLPTPDSSTLGTLTELEAVEGCTSDSEISDKQAMGTAVSVFVKANKSGVVRQFAVAGAGLTTQATTLVYVDRPVRLKATQICTAPNGFQLVLDGDVQYTKGWNMEIQSTQVTVVPPTETTPARATITITVRKGNLGTAEWYLLADSAQPLSLQKSKLPSFAFFR